MKKLYQIISLVSLSALLTACSGAPNPIPRGYSSYKEPYKSAPGEKANQIGYEFDIQKNKSVLEDMRYVAQDLVERLDDQLAFDTDTIYLVQPANNVFYKSLDYLIRSELIRRGYSISTKPESFTQINVGVLENVKPCNATKNNASDENSEYKTAFIQLAVSDNSEEISEIIDGFYEVPMYGFKPVNSYEVITPNCKKDNAVVDKIEPPESVEAIKLTE